MACRVQEVKYIMVEPSSVLSRAFAVSKLFSDILTRFKWMKVVARVILKIGGRNGRGERLLLTEKKSPSDCPEVPAPSIM